MNHVRALGWRGTCSGSVVPATPPYGLGSLSCGSQGPTHRRARTPVERCKKKRQEELLLQAWQPRTQDRGARSEPNQRARSTDPRQQTAWIDIIELSFNIAPNFCGVWTKKLRFFSGSCACCRAKIDGRAGRLGDCRPIGTMVEVCKCARCFSIQISPQISIVVAMPHCHCHGHRGHCSMTLRPAPAPPPTPTLLRLLSFTSCF
jgi:hypothetical protein